MAYLKLEGKTATKLNHKKFVITEAGDLMCINGSHIAETVKAGAWAKLAKGPSRAQVTFLTPMFIKNESLRTIVGADKAVRTQIVKKLWAFIKNHGLQDSKNRRNINVGKNALTKDVFAGKPVVSMFEMTKIISKHLTPAA